MTKPCSARFQVGMIAAITTHALQKTLRKGNISSSTATEGCMFVATTSGDAGRCIVHPELGSSRGYRCVLNEEADDDQHSTEDNTNRQHTYTL